MLLNAKVHHIVQKNQCNLDAINQWLQFEQFVPVNPFFKCEERASLEVFTEMFFTYSLHYYIQ